MQQVLLKAQDDKTRRRDEADYSTACSTVIPGLWQEQVGSSSMLLHPWIITRVVAEQTYRRYRSIALEARGAQSASWQSCFPKSSREG